jgi:DNA-binding transcriptional LysR family regulator
MDLRQISHFVAVAEERNFTRAASRMHVVQSAISASIKALEREVGADLFVRMPRDIELTAEGAALLGDARGVLEAMERLNDSVGSLNGVLRGQLAVGLLAAPDRLGISRVVASFTKEHPEVRIQVRSSTSGTAGLIAALLDESLDMSLILLPFPVPPTIRTEVLLSGRTMLAVQADHPLASRGSVSATEAAAYDFVDYPVGFSARYAVDAEFERLGVERDIKVEASGTELARSYILAGVAIGFLSDADIEETPGLVAVEVEGISPSWTGVLATKRDRHVGRAAAALRRLILERAATVVATPPSRTSSSRPSSTS